MSTLERIEAAADRLRQADPNLTEPQAMAKVLTEDPSLYGEYVAEGAGRPARSGIDDFLDEMAARTVAQAAAKLMEINPKLTRAQALSEVYRNIPDLAS